MIETLLINLLRFNSMIVRLKGTKQKACKFLFQKFQFYDSPIKSTDGVGRTPHLNLFQFYDSPIKSTSAANRMTAYVCFNSMIVRLKAAPGNMFFGVKAFQFYDSPIKRRTPRHARLRGP